MYINLLIKHFIFITWVGFIDRSVYIYADILLEAGVMLNIYKKLCIPPKKYFKLLAYVNKSRILSLLQIDILCCKLINCCS